MNTSTAPNYTNIFIDRYETKALRNYHLKPMFWFRFIDDIFMIWTHGQEQLDLRIGGPMQICIHRKTTHQASEPLCDLEGEAKDQS